MRGEESGRVGITDCEAGVRTGFAMTRFLQEVRCKAGGRTEASAPTHRQGTRALPYKNIIIVGRDPCVPPPAPHIR